MKVHGVGQWSCVRCQMKKHMMPPTIKLDSNWKPRKVWKGMRGYCEGAVRALRSKGRNMMAVVVVVVVGFVKRYLRSSSKQVQKE